MADIHSLTPLTEPVGASVVLACPVGAAFDAFTKDVGAWWPLATHSVWQERARTCRFEPGTNGRVVEVHDDGRETTWADVVVWEPPHRLVLLWYPGRTSDLGQNVEVQFVTEGDGTRVTLVHRDWQQTDDDRRRRNDYQQGWLRLVEREFSSWIQVNESAWTPSSPEHNPWK